MKIERHKDIVPHFWRVIGEEIELVPLGSEIDFKAFESFNIPSKFRNSITSDLIWDEFLGALTKDGPSLGMITVV